MKNLRLWTALVVVIATSVAAVLLVFAVRRRPSQPPVPVAAWAVAPSAAPVPTAAGTPAILATSPLAAMTHAQKAARLIRIADPLPAHAGANRVPTKADEPLPGAPAPIAMPPDFLEKMVDSTGRVASFALPGGSFAQGTVELVKRDTDGNLSVVQGRLSAPSPGFFFFVKESKSGVAGAFSGNARFDNGQVAYRAEPTGPKGTSMLVPRRIDQVMCLGLPAVGAVPGAGVNAPQTYPSPGPTPAYNNNVVSLQSLPGAQAVVYLDFNGGPGPWIGWGNFAAQPSGASNSDIREVWQRIAEDYQGFNVNITTDIKVFNAAPSNSRQHVMLTSTNTAAPGAGGVAYENSFNSSEDEVCWSFYTTGKAAAEVASHETGHTVGLSHETQEIPNGSGGTTHNEYFSGQGDGDVSWAPIMGAGYYDNLTQFSHGEFIYASNKEDQLAIIGNNNNNLAFRADDDGATFATAKYLEVLDNNSVSNEGILETTGDVDAYRFTVTASSAASFTVNPVNQGPNLDILASIYRSDDTTLIASANPATSLSATVSATLAPGDYTLRVTGTGYGDPTKTGYTNYGVVGAYLISGSVTNAVKPTRFSVAENSASGTTVGTVTPRNNHGASTLSYSITGGNSGAAFNINGSTGAISVLDPTRLNYEAISTRWDVPSVLTLFVTITDSSNSALNEVVRVVVAVTNVNEPPTITGGSASMIARTPIGTTLFTVTGSDPDQFDYPTFSIVGGNTGGVFAIDPAFGRISPAVVLNPAATTTYTLTVRATDQGTPALTADATVTITVVPLVAGYTPGIILDAYYENIGGANVSDLTGNAKFPANPDSEVALTSANDSDHGDNYGSVMRGFVIPPTTGSYTFWIASDDSGDLRISPDTNPANAVVRASNSSYTDPNVYNTFSSQQSVALTLTAGQPYYIEARQKEAGGGDHLSIAWQGPGFSQQVIPGRFLAPFRQNYAPSIPSTTFAVRRGTYVGSVIGTVPVKDVNTQDGHNGFAITGGNGGNLFSVDANTGVLRVNTSTSALLAGFTYTLNVRTSDTGTPVLSGTGTITINITDPSTINANGIIEQIWTGITGGSVSNLTSDSRYPYAPTTTRTLSTFEATNGYGSNYGARIRALVTPPTSGSYTFYVASDDASRLLLGTDATAASAKQIAYLDGYTTAGNYTSQASQTSSAVNLVAGQSYYIEALYKQGGGDDFLQVAWTGPGISSPTIIPGSALKPFNLNVAPSFNSFLYSWTLRPNSPNGTIVGTLAATDPEKSALVYAITGGNSSGAYAVDPATGVVTVANSAACAPGKTTTLNVGVQDDGIGGVYPLGTALASAYVTIPTPVDQWRQDNFGANAGNAAIAGNLADPDGDGLVNLVEYALGTNPLSGNASGVVVDQETVDGSTYLRLTVAKNPAATDVTYSVETTGDLSSAGSWSGSSVVVEANTSTSLRVRDSVPIGSASARFIRLRVSTP